MAETDQRRRRGDLKPNPQMWAALEGGPGLSRVLNDFYERVYADPQLAPFFAHVKKEWVASKQFSFLRDIFTGERHYFGMRPRNAHHWMVISDELFDHREELMAQTLRDHGLPEHLVAQFRELDEVFRKQIVKQRPIPMKIRGMAMPLEGYEQEILTASTLCDGCSAEIAVGTRASYHVRTGKTFCSACTPEPEPRDEGA